jgi:hypothetical protein
VITQSDEDKIRVLLKEYSEEWRKYFIQYGYRSYHPSFLDCESYRNLLKYGVKAIPYLVEGTALIEDDYFNYGWIGSAIIADKNVKTPEEVYTYNRNHRKGDLYPPANCVFRSATILLQLLPEEMKPKPDIKEGYVDDGKFAWSHWW